MVIVAIGLVYKWTILIIAVDFEFDLHYKGFVLIIAIGLVYKWAIFDYRTRVYVLVYKWAILIFEQESMLLLIFITKWSMLILFLYTNGQYRC